MIALLLLPPLLASLLAIVVRRDTKWVGWATVLLNGIALAASVWLCAGILWRQSAVPPDNDFWRFDALSGLLALCITGVTFIASMFGPGLDGADHYEPAQIRRFRIFVNAFALTMLLAVTTNNVGFMWVMIEATTITSALVIPLHRTKASVEASWKYLLICSVGIALAFAGTVLAYFDFVSTAGQLPDALNWTVLRGAAPALHPELMQLAFAFILIGYGTKAGLAPMHTWLPDAHSEAPAPMSAMMSGVLLAVAMYAVARWKAVVDAALGSASFTSTLLLAAGLLSVLIGASSLVIQRHYKRMLAYSSVEHMGIAMLGVGWGGIAGFGALLHVVNHSLAKAMLFLLSGNILGAYRTKSAGQVTGILRLLPASGVLWLAGFFAITGSPPFGLFVSELTILKGALDGRHFVLAGVYLALLLTVFVGMAMVFLRMAHGTRPGALGDGAPAREWLSSVIPPAVLGLAALFLGLYVPKGLTGAIDEALHTLRLY